MADYEVDPVHASNSGYEAAIARVRAHGLSVDLEPGAEEMVDDALRTARALLIDSDVSDRFTTLMSELVTIAAVSRVAYNEDPLDEQQIASFIDISTLFLNSWTHRHS